MNTRQVFVALAAVALLAGCKAPGSRARRATLSDQEVIRVASAAPLQATEARVITDNDRAFLSKVEMIGGARRSIDMAYYIYSDDYSSSYLTRALIDAARRGVSVRLIADYQTNYKRLDLFSMMEKLGGEGKGSLSVRLYNRPTRNVVEDAVYMTMNCGPENAADRPAGECSKEKFAAIDKLFADETIAGKPAAAKNISNLNVGNSGLFLSGLYSKRPDIMATAVQHGQGVDPSKYGQGASSATPQDKQNLKKLAKTYWESKTGSAFQRLESKATLYFAFQLYGQKLDPIYDTFTSLVPAEKKMTAEEKQDWDHLTDFSHHKLLFVDGSAIQLGGRNVEDSYHMHTNPLTEKYVFMDTDLRATLAGGGEPVTRSFDNLWNFDAMVAPLSDVRQHAPNDFAANVDAYKAAQEACGGDSKKPAAETCTDKEFQARARDLGQRMAFLNAEMERKAAIYRTQYLPTVPADRGPVFAIDPGAFLAYLENLPFDKSLAPQDRRRTYGAPVGEEAKSGKYIHDVWLRELTDVCSSATKDNPRQVILHNAYFYPAANLVYALSRMVNGNVDCSHVTVTVLTNSIQTTDLNIVNLAARHSLKAFTEFYQQHSDPNRRAGFEYYEYRPPEGGPNLSLHTKASVFGDNVIIGSANADVRSYMMDSNNAMLVRRAPVFASAYIGFVRGILNDPKRVQKLNDYFTSTHRDVMMQEDIGTFHTLLAKYHADKHLDAQQAAQIEQRFKEMLDDAYALTKQSIAADGASAKQKAQDQFDELFKPI